MKRSEFVKQIIQCGCKLYRHGSRHDIFINPSNGKKQPVPRHAEIDNDLVRHIRKKLGLSD
ncbi:MAG: type II toxin-antitoxin system HicA family toxin [Desulfomonile sp.]